MMVVVSDDREQLRTTFNSASTLYHQARPEYPAELYGELVRPADLRPGDRLLEVGCADLGRALSTPPCDPPPEHRASGNDPAARYGVRLG
jgi:hypothetical protein